ncbi:MAG: M1 family metallopeptidase [Planctomycetota bacterium]
MTRRDLARPSVRLAALAFAVASAAVAAAAQQRPLPHPLPESPEHAAAVAAGRRTAQGRPGPAAWRDRASYRITAELDPDLCLVRGSAAMSYHNGSPEHLGELLLHLRQNIHLPAARRNVDVEVTDGMRVDRILVGGKEAGHWLDGTILHVTLDDVLPPGGDVALAMDFAFTVPDGDSPRMGREGNELFFLGYWYPQFAVRDDVDGWVAEQYLGESEFYMPYADYEVAFTAPKGFLVQATGTLQNPTEVLTPKALGALAGAGASDAAVPIVDAEDLAAGNATLPGRDGRLTWRFAATNVRDFAISCASCYVWDAQGTDVGDRDGDGAADRCLIHALYRPRARTWTRQTRYAAHAITWMSHHVLPYPWPHATVVEGILGGGMEYPMMTLCGDGGAPQFAQGLTAHELGHMWFPMQVGSNETADGWLDEGLTDFCTTLIEADYWQRRNRAGSAAAEYLAVAASGHDREPLLRHADHLALPGSYGFNCYTKPKALLHQLAGITSYDDVLRGLSEYAAAWRWRHPQPLDFFRSMNSSLGQDLDWYWSSWWAETWTLDHAIAAIEVLPDGGTAVTVEDKGLAFLPATVKVAYKGGRTEAQVVPVATWLAGTRRAVLKFGPDVVGATVDPDRVTLDVDRDNDLRVR